MVLDTLCVDSLNPQTSNTIILCNNLTQSTIDLSTPESLPGVTGITHLQDKIPVLIKPCT
ncbi:hypothetical protein DPMN_130348 [Dreissena polymorpha]|uniref:Uncharacterized protein n=1 Tax=Dreissena polymorpha TaxID=45954 RepID=A0A9D4H6F5_DREPO|nr:hypothetical protein DPMN_130348 [Dreissena polymorpha]